MSGMIEHSARCRELRAALDAANADRGVDVELVADLESEIVVEAATCPACRNAATVQQVTDSLQAGGTPYTHASYADRGPWGD